MMSIIVAVNFQIQQIHQRVVDPFENLIHKLSGITFFSRAAQDYKRLRHIAQVTRIEASYHLKRLWAPVFDCEHRCIHPPSSTCCRALAVEETQEDLAC